MSEKQINKIDNFINKLPLFALQNEPKRQIIPVGLFPENDETFAGADELCQKLS